MKKLFFLNVFLSLFVKLIFAQCPKPSAVAELNANNVRATLLNNGCFWSKNTVNPGYEFPKVVPNSGITPIHALFCGGIWLSALDSTGQLRTAAMTYDLSNRSDFFSGPIDRTTNTVTAGSCATFDRFWEVTRVAVQEHLDNVSLSLPVPLASIDSKILEWPAKGNAHFTAYNIEDELAPFVDLNNNGIYDPENGDYPDIKGDQAFFWVVNDIGGPLTRTYGVPLEVEVHFLAYAYADPNSALNNTTFYDIEVVKKTPGSLFNLYFGLFVDPDLGYNHDDYIGCDTLSNSGFVYNAFAIDPQYGANPPIISTTFLNRSITSFNYFNNPADGISVDPDTCIGFGRYMRGNWLDGSSFTFGDDGIHGTIPTPFIFSGNPAEPAPAWSEVSSNQPIGDRRYLQCSSTPALHSMQAYDISVAVIAHETTGYTGAPDISQDVIPTIEEITQVYNDSFVLGNQYFYIYAGVSALRNKQVKIYPNPVTDVVMIDFEDDICTKLEILDMKGDVLYSNENIENTQELKVDMSNFNQGIYIVSLTINEENFFYKLVK